MEINYSPFLRWLKPVTENPEELYGKNNQKRILSTLPRVAETNVTHSIEPLNADFLTWFEPMYKERIGSKKNAAVHNLYEMTLGNSESLSEYWCLTLKQADKYIGGIIIGVREDRVMIAYRAFDYKWSDDVTLQANPSLYSEYLVSKWAFDLGKEWVSHGKDRNPYGLNANIGLALFKLSVGCSANVLLDNEDYREQTLNLSECNEDIFVLHYPTKENQITEATLVCTRETESKYKQLQSYPERLRVHVVYRD